MPSPNALVDRVQEVEPAAEPFEPARLTATKPPLTVRFAGGRTGLLDMSNPPSAIWADVLESLRAMEQPAYVEVDPATQYIVLLLIPLSVHVGVMKEVPDGFEVELIISHALHYLRRDRPHFQEMLATLQTAQKDKTELLVTETLDEHVIIDARRAVTPRRARRQT